MPLQLTTYPGASQMKLRKVPAVGCRSASLGACLPLLGLQPAPNSRPTRLQLQIIPCILIATLPKEVAIANSFFLAPKLCPHQKLGSDYRDPSPILLKSNSFDNAFLLRKCLSSICIASIAKQSHESNAMTLRFGLTRPDCINVHLEIQAFAFALLFQLLHIPC